MSLYYLEKSRIKEEFENASEPVKIVGYDGVVLGYFTPAKAEKVEMVIDFGPAISDEELDREMAAAGGRTLDEILADFEKRS